MLSSLMPDARGALQKIASELASTVERVESKERYINSTFGNLVCNVFVSVRDGELAVEWSSGPLVGCSRALTP